MKSVISAVLASAVLSGIANSAIYAYNNGAGTTASGIVDASGNAFRRATNPGDAFTGAAGGISAGPGIVAAGVFSTDSLASVTSVNQLLSLFTQIGDSAAFAAAAGGGNRGIFSLSSSSAIAGSQFAGKNMYFIAGNGLTLADSTQFVVFKSNTLFNAADDEMPSAINVTFRPDQGTTLFGSVISDVKTGNSDSSVTAGWQMAPVVPEPSSMLLGLIGLAGLLRRRRN